MFVYASKYGKDKLRQCAEFSFDRKSKKIILFLWLIIPNRKNNTIARMQIDTIDEYLTYWRYAPVKSGTILWDKFFNKQFYIVTKYSDIIVQFWGKEYNIEQTENIVERALKTWLERIH